MDEIDRWADINQDLLQEISKRLFSYDDDYVKLRLVCKNWRLKLPKIPHGNNIPWLLLPEETYKNHFYEDEEIYHLMQLPLADADETLDIQELEENQVHHITLPGMQMKNIVIRGSGHGWLVLLNISDGTMQLLNPFTHVSLGLPPISTFPIIIKYDADVKEYTYWNFVDLVSTLDSDLMHKICVWKVIINSSPDHNSENFMAVAIFGQCKRLAFYKFGNRRWVEFPERDKHSDFEDVIYFQEKIYAINRYLQVYEFDTKTTAWLRGGIRETRFPYEIPSAGYQWSRYLVGCSNGSLLILIRHVFPPVGRISKEFETCKFDIYELKRNRKEWSRIADLGKHILLIGYHSSVEIPVPFSSKGNQIWFTDDQMDLRSSFSRDNGIFDLDDGSFQRLLLEVKFFCTPVWLLP